MYRAFVVLWRLGSHFVFWWPVSSLENSSDSKYLISIVFYLQQGSVWKLFGRSDYSGRHAKVPDSMHRWPRPKIILHRCFCSLHSQLCGLHSRGKNWSQASSIRIGAGRNAEGSGPGWRRQSQDGGLFEAINNRQVHQHGTHWWRMGQRRRFSCWSGGPLPLPFYSWPDCPTQGIHSHIYMFFKRPLFHFMITELLNENEEGTILGSCDQQRWHNFLWTFWKCGANWDNVHASKFYMSHQGTKQRLKLCLIWLTPRERFSTQSAKAEFFGDFRQPCLRLVTFTRLDNTRTISMG